MAAPIAEPYGAAWGAVRYLAGREGPNNAIRLFHAVYQLRGKMIPEAVQTFLLYPRCFENSVVPLAEVGRPGVAALLVAYGGRCGAEVTFLVQSLIACTAPHSEAQEFSKAKLLGFSGGCFHLADFDFSSRCILYPIPLADFLYSLAHLQKFML